MVFSLKLTATGNGQRRADKDEIRRALAALADPESCTIVGIVSGGHGARGHTMPGTHLNELAQMASVLGESGNVYYCLNPVPVTFSRGHGVPKDEEILRRRWILIDVDTKRPQKTKQGATDDERNASWPVCVSVHGYLTEHNWPQPIVIDSGNGWHLLYRCDLPNDDHAKGLVKNLLKHLGERFDSEAADIDEVVYPAKQIAKLPGTWALKGPNLPDRPYRMAKIVELPDDLSEVVTGQMIVDLLGAAPLAETMGNPIVATTTTVVVPPIETGQSHPFELTAPGTAERLAAWVRAALTAECKVLAGAMLGTNLNKQLSKSAYYMGQLIPACGLNEELAKQELLAAAQQAGANNPKKDRSTLNRGIEDGKAEPRELPDFSAPYKTAPIADPEPPAGEIVIIRASEVDPRPVEWLWPGRIPLGKLTTFAGNGGLGKTFVLCDIAARLSKGAEWPDGEPGGEIVQTLFISGEDDLDDTLVPRLIELQADLTKIAFLTTKAIQDFSLAALKLLTAAIGQIGPETRLVVIDPPTAYLGDVNDHKNAELRRLLTPLQGWASLHRASIVFNTHVNKTGGAKVEAMQRVMGSVAWVNGVRSAHMFTKDPDDKTRRLFIPFKCNISEEKKGLAYKLVKTDSLCRIEWCGEVDTSADDALNSEAKAKPKRAVAAAVWLEELFAGTDEVPSKTIYDRAKAETNLSNDALKEAKDEMDIKASQRCDPDNNRSWWWYWPPAARQRWLDKKTPPTDDAEQF